MSLTDVPTMFVLGVFAVVGWTLFTIALWLREGKKKPGEEK